MAFKIIATLGKTDGESINEADRVNLIKKFHKLGDYQILITPSPDNSGEVCITTVLADVQGAGHALSGYAVRNKKVIGLN